ncbi:MAG: initiation factor 2B [Thermoprotei archaeon]|nr:MAG: initiation factor 2B [Thermoprotei archaeon]
MAWWEDTIREIAEYRIYSSTDAVLRALELFPQVFKRAYNLRESLETLAELVNKLVEVRPTSVMLNNMMRRLLRAVEKHIKAGRSASEIADALELEIKSLRRELESAVNIAATLGARRVRNGDTLMTCSYSKTIMALFHRLREEGKRVRVYVTESRPGSEGVEMAKEISSMGFEVELIVDSAVRFFMKDVDLVVVGAEAIAANGAVVNKVGTSMIALAAHEARVRTFVIATTHKFSHETIFGELVRLPIIRGVKLLPGLEREADLSAESPLFDVTPPEYIDAIITERGVVAPEAVILLVRELYGWPPETMDVISAAHRLLEVVESGAAS